MATSRRAPQPVTVRDLVSASLLEHVEALRTHAPAARDQDPRAIHLLRTTARRLRSVLTAYRLAFDPGATDLAVEELRWFGRQLGEARDAHVLRAHVARVLADQPVELVIDAVASRLDLELGRLERDGAATARAAVESARFDRLVDSLAELVQAGPWAADAGLAATTVGRRVVGREASRLRRAVRAAATGRDADLHAVRKQAKRLRYAAECAQPALGRRAAALAKRAKRVQAALGDHQDSVVARARLRELGVAAHLDGMNAFTFGRLHGLEDLRAERAVREFTEAARRLPQRRVKRWLRH